MKKITSPTMRQSERIVESVSKALDILSCFSDEEPELSLKQLSEKTGLYKNRIIRICGTLASQGFIIRTSMSRYKLGPMILVLGKVYERTNSLISVSRPILKDLAFKTGESSKMFVIEGSRRVCILKEKGPSPFQFEIDEGRTMDLHVGSGSKVLLAYGSDEQRNRVLSQKLKKVTTFTITDKKLFEKEFELIRKRGYAISLGESVEEVAGMAAPIFDSENKICAVITISGPIQRFTPKKRMGKKIELLLAAAKEISFLLGSRNSQ